MLQVLFYLTLTILLVSILAGATCLSAYLVSHRRTYLYACAGFLIYFIDVTLVLKDDFLTNRDELLNADPYIIGHPFISIITGGGLLAVLWGLTAYLLEKNQRQIMTIIVALFSVISTVVITLFPVGKWNIFLFYQVRQVFVLGALCYLALSYFKTERLGVRQLRILKFKGIYLLLGIGVIAITSNDVISMLILDPKILGTSSLGFFPERNFMENLVVATCALYAVKSAVHTLQLRYHMPPNTDTGAAGEYIGENILVYSRAKGLSERETEVLRLVLAGKDNRNIAEELFLAVSTIKVHVHNILQKTKQEDRQSLIRDFWEKS